MHSRIPQPVLIHRQAGFTLLELSIVLVIIGLLVGAVFAGTAIIRSMELKSITSEANEYRTGIASFRDRFHAFPGDMANATQIWGAVGDVDAAASCPDDAGTGTETCDGNGDHKIAPVLSTLAPGSQPEEAFRAWEHMQNALLVRTQVTGLEGADGSRDATVGGNIPRSVFDKAAGWSLFHIPYGNTTTGNCREVTSTGGFTQTLCRFDASDNIWVFTKVAYGNVLTLGAEYDMNYALKPILPPQDADSIDAKFDDGLPGSGSLLAVGDYAGDGAADPDCFEVSDPTGAGYTTNLDYSINERENACALIFILD